MCGDARAALDRRRACGRRDPLRSACRARPGGGGAGAGAGVEVPAAAVVSASPDEPSPVVQPASVSSSATEPATSVLRIHDSCLRVPDGVGNIRASPCDRGPATSTIPRRSRARGAGSRGKKGCGASLGSTPGRQPLLRFDRHGRPKQTMNHHESGQELASDAAFAPRRPR